MKLPLVIVYCIFLLLGCSQRVPVSKVPLLPKDSSKKLERENTLVAFVGEKISFQELPNEGSSFDNAYLATYRILQRVYGHFESDTITFRVFDHKGYPEFTKFPTVLLYVSKGKNYYYQEKYQFNEVYLTEDGRWAGYSDDYPNQFDSVNTIKAQKIEFKNKNIADTGNYVEDLFRLKKNSVLAYRGLFGDTIPVIPPVEIELVADTTTSN